MKRKSQFERRMEQILDEKPQRPTKIHKREKIEPPKVEIKEDYLTEGLE